MKNKRTFSNLLFLYFVTGAATEYASYTSSPYTQYTSSPYAGYSYSTTGTSGLLSRYFAYVVGFARILATRLSPSPSH